MLPASDHDYLRILLVLLLAAILAVPLVQRLRISPVLGYLVAGIAVGPSGLRLVRDTEEVAGLAEFGIIFLLFTVGLDLPWRRLRAMWRDIFGLGLAQVALTSLLAGIAAFWLGATPEAALVIGGALAFSSTATVLELLRERGEKASRFGRLALAILLFQDLAVVPLLAVLPLLEAEGSALVAALGFAFLKAVVALAVIFALGGLVLRPIYRQIAATRNAEILTATNLLVALGTGWATAQAGMSMAMGALLAGLLLAGTEYKHQVEADIQPFRGLFLGLFFITVGMMIDLSFVVAHLPLVLGVMLALLVGKAVVLGGLGLVFGLRHARTARLALTLSQGGEFAFVVLGLALTRGLVTPETAQMLIAAIAASIAVTPLLYAAGQRIAATIEKKAGPELDRLATEADDLSDHFVLAGFGRLGAIVGELLATLDIPYVAIEADQQLVEAARRSGAPVYFGDASRVDVLRAAGVERARGAMIVLNRPDAAERIVSVLRQNYPDLVIIARSRDALHSARLGRAGANSIIVEMLEPGLQIAASAMRASGRAVEEIELTIASFRRRTPGTSVRDSGEAE